MDADIVLNKDFLNTIEKLKLTPEKKPKPKSTPTVFTGRVKRIPAFTNPQDSSTIYGIDRYDISKTDELFKDISTNQKYDINHAGYFQLYYDKSKYYPKFSEDASLCDMHFINLFSNKKMINSYVFHLGQRELHWNGRNCDKWN